MADVLPHLIWIFPLYSFLGWCLEVIYCSVFTGKFVNRGFLNGCICPIYGLGAGLMILLLTPVKPNLLALFLGALILGSLLELIGGFLLKHTFHITWWDYAGRFLNLGGYICLRNSLMWGALGVVLLQIVHPFLAYLVLAIPTGLRTGLLVLFYVYFAVDAAVTLLSALKLKRDLREITRLSALIHKGSDAFAQGLGDSAIGAAHKITESKAREVVEHLLSNRDSVRLRLFKAFPNMRAQHHNNALHEMKQRIKDRVHRK